MKKILTNLHLLLQDMILSSEARRTGQNVLRNSEQPLTLIDVKKIVSEQFKALQESEEIHLFLSTSIFPKSIC
ncbi:MAG: hypothetical protein MJY47_05915 [Fibrobacter sp.]|nr:hypothetical protein [Fibrobacter sp.]